jgi:twitching motility protein PilT
MKGAGVETSGYSGGFVPGPSPVPAGEETTVSPLDPAWQPPAAAAQPVPAAFLPAGAPPIQPGYEAVPDAAAVAAVSAELAEMAAPTAPAPVAAQPVAAPPAAAPAPPAPPAEVQAAAAPVAPPAPPAPPPVAPAPFPPPPQAAAPPAAAPVEFAAATWQEPAAEGGVGIAQSEAFEGAYSRGSTEEVSQADDIDLHVLLSTVLERGASDLHLTTGSRPQLRINGHLSPLEDFPFLTPPVIQRVMYAAITQRQREKFEEVLELDFAYSVPGKARFRVNMYRQRDSVGAAFRLIPFEIKKLEDLGLPPGIANFAMLPRGFVLVTGPTGSGKSTTLASIVDLANRQRRDHIMTVEDPIEFLHTHQSCVVNQREVGEDTHSFGNALKHVLRQDPDIILVGEMRDLETISVALTAAETGHLVFATLHTQDAAQTIDRIIDVFPPHQQQQVRVQLAGSLQGVVCQTLARTVDGQGRAVATEILIATPAVRNLIREGKTHQIYSAMQAGSQHGMHTMDQHLADLVKRGRITYETGLEKCHHIEDFNRLTGRS